MGMRWFEFEHLHDDSDDDNDKFSETVVWGESQRFNISMDPLDSETASEVNLTDNDDLLNIDVDSLFSPDQYE